MWAGLFVVVKKKIKNKHDNSVILIDVWVV